RALSGRRRQAGVGIDGCTLARSWARVDVRLGARAAGALEISDLCVPLDAYRARPRLRTLSRVPLVRDSICVRYARFREAPVHGNRPEALRAAQRVLAQLREDRQPERRR